MKIYLCLQEYFELLPLQPSPPSLFYGPCPLVRAQLTVVVRCSGCWCWRPPAWSLIVTVHVPSLRAQLPVVVQCSWSWHPPAWSPIVTVHVPSLRVQLTVVVQCSGCWCWRHPAWSATGPASSTSGSAESGLVSSQSTTIIGWVCAGRWRWAWAAICDLMVGLSCRLSADGNPEVPSVS